MFEGLPIRQWRQAEATVGPAANQIQQPLRKDAWPEAPMPRDSHLLPDHSQALLRAARAGMLYKLPTPPEEEEKEKGEEEEEAKETQTGYVTKKWSQVPRHQEEPEQEYLAKRRKGLLSAYSGQTGSNGAPVPSGPMRETKVKKTDADGNVHVYKVLVPEGQTVEGEVAEEDSEMKEAAPEEAPPGTVVEGVGVVNAEGVVVANQPTPPRRRPPPPRRKPKKGPGRGRKKVMFTPGEGSNGTTTNPDGTQQAGDPNIKTEGTPAPGDTPMAEGGEDDEEGSEGSEGEDDDDENREEGGSPTPGGTTPMPKTEEQATPGAAPVTSETALTSVLPEGESAPVATTEAPPAAPEPIIPKKRRAESGDRDRSSSPDLPLASAVSNSSRHNSAARQTRTPTPVVKKSATPPQTTATKEEPQDELMAPAQDMTEQIAETSQEPAKEKTPEKMEEEAAPEQPQDPGQPAEQPEEQPTEQQHEPEKMEVDVVAHPEAEPPAAPAQDQAAEGEVDIFGSLEQQLENDGKN